MKTSLLLPTRSLLAAALSCLAPLAGAAVAPASASADAPCMAVFGHGRNLSATEPKANDTWNRINHTFNLAVAEALRPLGRPTVTFLVPVEGKNIETMLPTIVRLAGAENCDTLVETSMYADPQRQLFVSRVTLRRLALSIDMKTGRDLALGPVQYDREVTGPMNSETLANILPADVARDLLKDLVPARAP
jgi:hypothetical protein